MFINTKEASKKWGISDRRVRILCSSGKILGAFQDNHHWKIPINAIKPIDSRYKSSESMIELVDKKKNQLNNRRPLTDGELSRLSDEFVVEYTYNSNALEGNLLSLRETYMALRGVSIQNKSLEYQIQAINHKEVFEFVKSMSKKNLPLTDTIIKQINYLLLINNKEDRGIYRKIPIKVLGLPKQPVEPQFISKEVNNILNKYLNSSDHILLRIVKLHLDLSTIQPFIDANGRTSRFVMNFELLKHGYPPIIIKHADMKYYYDAFELYNTKANSRHMEKIIINYINEQIDHYLSII